MIYYKITSVNEDGSLKNNTLGRRDKMSDAETWAKKLAGELGRVAVVKITEQHLGTYGSKDNGTN